MSEAPLDSPEPIDRHFVASVHALRGFAGRADTPSGLSPAQVGQLLDAGIASRHLDLAARRLRAAGKAFYAIGSSGHESNGAVAMALRPTDPALLHYRSGAFYVVRAGQAGAGDPIRDVLAGTVAAAAEPISGGRHKVFGRRDLHIVPQTSTIASHLPRAVGLAYAIEHAAKQGLTTDWPGDAIVVCTFGDASANHSTATGAINTALHTAYRGSPVPLLLVCEDNGIGISTKTPLGWIEATLGKRPGLAFFGADGTDMAEVFDAATAAATYVRAHRRPALLHLRTVRLMGHAGSDYEASYRTATEIAADYERDPVLCLAKYAVTQGYLTAAAVLERYEAARARVADTASEVTRLPQLEDAAAIARPITDMMSAARAVRVAPAGSVDPGRSDVPGTGGVKVPRTGGVNVPGTGGAPRTLAVAINGALAETLDSRPEALVFGEDVGRKGGVYGVTRGLRKRFGPSRVIDTLLDEQSILGLALGAGLAGLLPIPEIQYLAYFHNAADQIRGEGASLPFFSTGQYRNPMVVRIAGYGYQKGFGGHFHNDNAVAALRDIPGLIIASPARPDDAGAMLHTCVAVARETGAICVFLEPIALYHTRDLHSPGDGLWLAGAAAEPVPVGRARTYGSGRDLTIVTFANGVYMSLRVAQRLAHIGIRVVDLRWIAPLPVADILREATATGRVLIVDETRRSGGVSEGIVAELVDSGFRGLVERVASADSFVPLGDAARHVLLSEATIEAAARDLAERPGVGADDAARRSGQEVLDRGDDIGGIGLRGR